MSVESPTSPKAAAPQAAPAATAEASPAWRDALIRDPDRVRDDGELLRLLGLKLAPANVVEFGPAALARLEAARVRESAARHEMESLARANFAAQATTHDTVVDLLKARNNADLAHRLDTAACGRFGLIAGVLAVEEPGPIPAGWTALASGAVDAVLGRRAGALMGGSAAAALFGEEADAVGSHALVRLTLWRGGRPGLLALAGDADAFAADMAPDLLVLLARVAEQTAERWPPLA